MKLLILRHKDVTDLLPMTSCIQVMKEALESLARGDVHMPLRMMVCPPDAAGILALMPAYVSNARSAYGVKSITVFPGNSSVGKDAHQGSVQLFSAQTGELLALVNASAVTAIRTAAVSALATQVLAREDAGDLAIIGAGVQARAHLAAISEVRPIRRVRVMDFVPERAHRFAHELSAKYKFPVEAANSAEAAVKDADIIVTVTNANEPVLRRPWIATGAHINAVGACTPQARELDTATVVDAKLYVDCRESTLRESGDFLLPVKEGAIGPQHIKAELGEVLLGQSVGRESDDEITLFKALGLAAEDLAAAEYLYRQAIEQHAGTWVDF